MHRKIKVFMHPILRDRRLALAFLACIALAFIATLFFYSPQLGCLSLAGIPLLGVALPEAEFQQKVLDGVESHAQEIRRLKDVCNDLHVRVNRPGGIVTARKPGTVSDGCAEFLCAAAYRAADRRGKLADFEPNIRAAVLQRADSILQLEQRSLTTSEIPLPVGYGNEIIELVAEFGAARRYGTSFPMGTGTMKFPRRKTAPTFELIAMSQPIPEKKPATEFVTFTADKYGGYVALPREISQDSFAAVGQWIALYMAQELAACEDRLYFIADGTARRIATR